MYMRFMTAAYLRQNADMFFPFLEGYMDMADFCQREVEPMDKESEQMQIMALQQALNVCIHIEEINSSSGSACRVIRFPDTPEEHVFAVPATTTSSTLTSTVSRSPPLCVPETVSVPP